TGNGAACDDPHQARQNQSRSPGKSNNHGRSRSPTTGVPQALGPRAPADVRVCHPPGVSVLITLLGLPMSLSEIHISNLRCIEHAEIRLPPGLTLIYGGNGSGKTSLLEGAFVLGRGRSFRTRNSERLISRGQIHMRVNGVISRAS